MELCAHCQISKHEISLALGQLHAHQHKWMTALLSRPKVQAMHGKNCDDDILLIMRRCDVIACPSFAQCDAW